jgi:ABC-type branched-subunit amino acid transport system substrate-binding protein
MGCAQANAATLVVDEINASGGVLGSRLELILEDSATDILEKTGARTRSAATVWAFERHLV